MAKVYVIAEFCPMPCLTSVIIVKCKSSARLFAWCVECNCAWADPAAETWERFDLGNFADPSMIAKGEIVLPSFEDLTLSGLADLIVSEKEVDAAWLSLIAEFNTKHGDHSATQS